MKVAQTCSPHPALTFFLTCRPIKNETCRHRSSAQAPRWSQATECPTDPAGARLPSDGRRLPRSARRRAPAAGTCRWRCTAPPPPRRPRATAGAPARRAGAGATARPGPPRAAAHRRPPRRPPLHAITSAGWPRRRIKQQPELYVTCALVRERPQAETGYLVLSLHQAMILHLPHLRIVVFQQTCLNARSRHDLRHAAKHGGTCL